MKVIQPGVGPGRVIQQFGSVGAKRLGGIRFNGVGALAFLRIAAGGHLGRHPTVQTQVYCVVEAKVGSLGGDGERQTIVAGEAAVWEPGEEHESGTETGMTVAVLETSSVRLD